MNRIKKRLKIEGMHCSSCALNIDFDLEDLPGIQKAKTSYAKQESEIEFDGEKLTLDEIFMQIKKTGYKAQIKNDDKLLA